MKSFEINRILVPVDFSDVSLEALETAAGIAKRQEAKLTILNVVEFLQYPSHEYPASFTFTVVSEMNKAAENNLKKYASDIKNKYQINVQTLLLMGNVTDTIIETAVNKSIDLILMGTHGASGLREFFIGSNAYSVIKKAPCPVLTIPGGKQKDVFKKILFPVRLVTHALDKYEVVREVVRKNNASLHVLGIVAEQVSEESVAALKNQLKELYAGLDEDGIAYSSLMVESNNPAREALREAEAIDADLIVTTANLDHTFSEFFVGPYVQQIVNHSKYPVLSVRPPLSPDTLAKMKKKATKEDGHSVPDLGLAM